MTTKYFLVYYSRYGKTIKAVCKGFPQFNIESSFAFIVEAIDPVNTGTLVVASQEKKSFRDI